MLRISAASERPAGGSTLSQAQPGRRVAADRRPPPAHRRPLPPRRQRQLDSGRRPPAGGATSSTPLSVATATTLTTGCSRPRSSRPQEPLLAAGRAVPRPPLVGGQRAARFRHVHRGRRAAARGRRHTPGLAGYVTVATGPYGNQVVDPGESDALGAMFSPRPGFGSRDLEDAVVTLHGSRGLDRVRQHVVSAGGLGADAGHGGEHRDLRRRGLRRMAPAAERRARADRRGDRPPLASVRRGHGRGRRRHRRSRRPRARPPRAATWRSSGRPAPLRR